MTAQDVIKHFNLKPHPEEGGYFIETYRCGEMIAKSSLDNRYPSDRSINTAIYFLLTPDTFSEMHTLISDEIFHFYLGDPVEMLLLSPDGSGKKVILGNDIFNNMSPQVVVPKNIWQGSRLIEGGKFALLGTTVAPGFEFEDYISGKQKDLIKQYPAFEKEITALTRH